MDWIEIAKTWGPNVALIAFFTWRDWKREDRMSGALDKQNSIIVDICVKAVLGQNNTAAAIDHLARGMEALAASLHGGELPPPRHIERTDWVHQRQQSGPNSIAGMAVQQ